MSFDELPLNLSADDVSGILGISRANAYILLHSKKKRNKRANGEGSIVNRSDGRWEGRYSLGFDPETGKQIRNPSTEKRRMSIWKISRP